MKKRPLGEEGVKHPTSPGYTAVQMNVAEIRVPNDMITWILQFITIVQNVKKK